MHYIVFDLEWTNGYNYVTKGFMNEVIEIGAVKLDEKLNIVDTYKQLVKPKFAKKLSSRCKNLTKITNEDIKNEGIAFVDAFDDFAKWCESTESVFLSWSNSDLYVLANNFKVVTGNCDIPFLRRYCDAQKYCMSFIERENNNQVSLLNCAQMLGIYFDTSSLHRALADCYLTVECFKKVFNSDEIAKRINSCDKVYYEKLLYKPYLITKPKTDDFDIYEQVIYCPKCGPKIKQERQFELINKSFRCPTRCERCKKTYWTTIRARKLYDKVDVYVRSVEMNKKRAKKIK